jgi:tetratricopeptide (TPR) repeat protein
MNSKLIFVCFLLVFQTFTLKAQESELSQANGLFRSFMFKEAIPLYEQALEKDAYLGDGMLNLARCFYYTNNLDKAEFWYSKIMKYDGYKQYGNEYGMVLKMNGKYTDAKKVFLEYARINQNAGYQYAQSCDFAMAPTPFDHIYEVVHLPKMNSKSADFAPTFYYDELIFASSKSVAIQKQGDVAWTNDAFNQHYTISRDAQGGISETPALRSFIGNDINDAPMSYLPGVDLVAITSNNFMDGIRHIDGSCLLMDIYLYKKKNKKEWNTSTE